MKKFYIVLLNMLLLCLLIFPQKTQSVFARNVTSNWIIAEDTQIDGETDGDLLIEGVQSGSAIVIESGANVTLKNLTINIAEGQTLSSVISIEAGAKLILENVIVTLSSKPTHAIIANEGMLEIDNCVFPNILSLVVVDNNANEVGSLLLHNVAEKSLARIKLSQGSIYVDKSTSIDGVINVCIDKTYDEILQSGERYIGRAIVKGIDTFAGKFLENFQFDGAPNESEIDGTSEYLFENFKDETYGYKYYLDYVGYLGDDLNVCNDGYRVTYNDGENDVYVDTINSGDIILTQFSVKYYIDQLGDQYKKFIDHGVVNVGGKYATARLFLKYAQMHGIGNFYVYGTILKKNNKTGEIDSTTQKLVLDNFTTLLGKNSSSKQNYINCRGIVSFQPLNVKTFSVGESGTENALETQTLKACPSVLVKSKTDDPDVLYTSNYLANVDLNGYSFEDIVAGEGLNVTRLISTQDYEILNIELSQSFSGDVKINLKEKTSTKNVSLAIENSDLTYNSLDQISNCTPYYMDGENKIYLQNDEFKIYKVENDTQTQTEQIINAGDYKIVVCEREGFVFENTEFDVAIRPIGLTIEYTKTNFVYDGEAKFVEAEVTGVINDDVEISYNNNGQILPGNYTITAEIVSDTNNYYILDACKECTLFIDKATIDMSQVVVEDRIVEYTGEKFSITPKNLVEGLQYRCNGPYSDVGTYPIQITFLVADLNLYYPLKDNENIKKVELTITPKIIDLSYIEFSDIHHTYDGTAVNVEVSQEVIKTLPNEVSKEITINGDGVVNASDTPYDVTIVFKLNANYLKNYSLSPATHTCKIYIYRATIDESVFVFEDLTVEYDGEKHLIDAKNIPDVIQCENTTGHKTVCGSYTQEFRLTLLDTQNYNALEKDKYTATLNIVPANFDMSEVGFPDTIVSYEPNTFHVLQASGYSEHLKATYFYYLNGNLLSNADITGVCDAGEYTIIAKFTPMGDWENNSNPVSDMSAKLIINKKVIDLSGVNFADKTITYDGNTHSLEVTNAHNILFEYSQSNLINAGVYEITATPIFDTENYQLKDDIELKAILTINKSKIDMSGIEFNNVLATYDKQLKVAKITGELPSGVSVEYTNNEQINAGEYIAVASFVLEDSTNVEDIPNKTCTIQIKPKSISVHLNRTIFVYSSEPVYVSAFPQGVIDGDIVGVTLKNNGNINAGRYDSEIVLSNANYKCSENVSYTIEKADLDLSNITFNDVEVTYDGAEHTPKLIGALPIGVTANIVTNKVIDVGDYISYVDFQVVNPNYKTPDRLIAYSKVLPKPILVEFSNFTNLVEDGTRHDVKLSFVGVVEDNFDDYKLIYSAEPVSAGEYIVRVELNKNSNYVILGANTLNFEILTSEKTYINQDLEILIRGDGFSTNSDIVVMQNQEKIEEKLLDAGIVPKEYSAFKLEMNDVENRKEISVSLKPNTINMANSKSIKVYKLSNNGFTAIDFELKNDKINFVANLGDEIVIVEEKDELEKNQLLIAVVIISALVSIGVVVFVAFKKRPKKAKTNYFIDIDMQ